MKFELNDNILVLERTPELLKNLLEGLPLEWTTANEGEDSWSPFDIIGHLIHGERTDWMVRANIILSQGANCTFEPYDRFAQMENSKGKTLGMLLNEFSILRKKNLAELKSKNLSEKDLGLTGMHPELGVVTLRELLATWMVHDLGHITQISRVMAKQYKNEVGPWKQYLTILNHTPQEGS